MSITFIINNPQDSIKVVQRQSKGSPKIFSKKCLVNIYNAKNTRKEANAKKQDKKARDKGWGKIRGLGAREYGFGNNAREAARTNFGNRGVYKPSKNKDDNKKDNSQSEVKSEHSEVIKSAQEPLQQTHSESS